MVSCTDFIPAYSELFRFLHERDGKPAVVGNDILLEQRRRLFGTERLGVHEDTSGLMVADCVYRRKISVPTPLDV